jgi:surface protein
MICFNAINFNQNISNWDTTSVINMSNMFRGARRFNQNINTWDVHEVFDMSGMFHGATRFNQSLSRWDVSGVGLMDNMFRDASNFDQSLASWSISHVRSMNNMFRNATLSSKNYGLTLIGWDGLANSDGVENSVNFHGGESSLPVFSLDPAFFLEAIRARNDLVSAFGWTIIDADSVF